MKLPAFNKIQIHTFFVCLLISPISIFGQVSLPRLISDGLVLQRDAEVKIWGWSAPNEKISLEFLDSTYHTVGSQSGDWAIILKALKAGGPYRMKIEASNTIDISNIMIGDVWVSSGQSNIELPMRRVSWIYPEEIKNCENNYIRQFKVPQGYDFNKQHNNFLSGSWKTANSDNIMDFSAVAYFYAKELYRKYSVPIGIINVSLGGSPAEAWMSEDALKNFSIHYDELQQYKDSTYVASIIKDDRTRIQNWYTQIAELDEGYKNDKKPWSKADTNSRDWKTIQMPAYWNNTELEKINGVVWYRRTFSVNSESAKEPAKLILGRIVDADSVFINGVFVGTTSYQYPPRRYNIPAGLLKKGENSIVIRVISNIGTGGFVPEKEYKIVTENSTVDLQGIWQYKIGATIAPLASQTFVRWKPGGLYNSMIYPILNFRIKGVIWYQGESNTGRPIEYAKLFPQLIKDWRRNWKQGDFPFIFAQLPNFMEPSDKPTESNWALLRESQLKTLSVSNTGMAVTIDLGEWNDIHPVHKKEVAYRLAIAADKVAYGNNADFSTGPLYQSMNIEGNEIILTFSNIGSGLVCKEGDELKHFAISGADNKFVWAKAIIKDNKVIVWNDRIHSPVAVRYAWANNPEGANLYNKENLPASPFRTDK